MQGTLLNGAALQRGYAIDLQPNEYDQLGRMTRPGDAAIRVTEVPGRDLLMFEYWIDDAVSAREQTSTYGALIRHRNHWK